MIRGASPLSGVAGNPAAGNFTPAASGDPPNDGDAKFVAISATEIALKYKSGGVVRQLILGDLEP